MHIMWVFSVFVKCFMVNYFAVFLSSWWSIINIFFCCLMVNYVILFLPSYHELSHYFFCLLIVNILEIVVVVLWWINLICYQMSHSELPCCLVVNLWFSALDILLDISWWNFWINYQTSHGEYFLYIFWCLTVNSDLLHVTWWILQIICQIFFRGSGVPKFRRPSKIMPNSTQLWKLLKIAEFRMPTPQDVQKKEAVKFLTT
jgi:hypothetical protein